MRIQISSLRDQPFDVYVETNWCDVTTLDCASPIHGSAMVKVSGVIDQVSAGNWTLHVMLDDSATFTLFGPDGAVMVMA